jgi:hypothetical protein
MQVTRMEAVDDAAAGHIENGALPADGPIAREPPLVKSRRHDVDVARVGNCAAWRHEVLCAVIPNIGLRRSDLVLVRGRLGAPRIHYHQTRPPLAVSCFSIEFGAAGGRRKFPGLDCVGRFVLEGPPEGSSGDVRQGRPIPIGTAYRRRSNESLVTHFTSRRPKWFQFVMR